MDARSWIPIRWRSGPLEIEQGTSRADFSSEEREALEQWGSPRLLERLEGTPFNCLVVTWADGSSIRWTRYGYLASPISDGQRSW